MVPQDDHILSAELNKNLMMGLRSTPRSTSCWQDIGYPYETFGYFNPQLVDAEQEDRKEIVHNHIRYKTPTKIPPDAWNHIQNKHLEPSKAIREQNSYFDPAINRKLLDAMIKETCLKAEHYKVNEKKTKGGDKIIYRFQEYDRVIGYHGERHAECRWLVVVAKHNGWVKTAFPVPGPFLLGNARG